MQRPLWYRVFVGLWGLWFITALSAPAVLHACPVHADHMAHGASMSGAMHHSHQMAPSRSLAGGALVAQPDQNANACCTCLGSCCCAGTVARAGSVRAPFVAAAPTVAAVPAAHPMPARMLVAYAHPFAQGPPVVSETLIG